ncbi:MAG: GDSL-type esterase/lipase family protein [Oscillospiraceae bacterium]|jgi:lysophospholipase L1-like esterase|nr:GDSL-type esterase/lipase family protein [Oscillospiraceae bacterium]
MQHFNEKILRQKKRRRKLFLWRAAICLCILSLLAAAVEGTTAVMKGMASSQAASSRPVSSVPPASSRASSQLAASSSAAPSSSQASSEPQSSSTSPSQAEPDPEPAPEGWFSNALFIGDSRTEGLRNYDGLPGATYYAVKGLMVNTVYTKDAIRENGTKKTVMQAQKNHPFGKIYLMLGVNELGWVSMKIFVSDYEKIVSDLKKDHPDARIYLQGIFPVSAKKSASTFYKNEKIAVYNQEIKKIAERQKVTYLDTAGVVSTNGVLPDEASNDGVHLNSEYCAKWCDYLKTHTE